MKKIRLKTIVIIFMTVLLMRGISALNFASESENGFDVTFRVYDPEGKLIDPEKVQFKLRGKKTGLYTKDEVWNNAELMIFNGFDGGLNVNYNEKYPLRYSLFADMGSYIFQINGAIPYETLKENQMKGNASYKLDVKLSDMTTVEILPTVDGKFMPNTTVSIIPVNGIISFWPTKNTSVVSRINPVKKSIKAYLNVGEYVPVFTSESRDTLIYYHGKNLKVKSKSPQVYKYNQVKSALSKKEISVEGRLKNMPFYGISIRAMGEYSHWNTWQKEKINFYYNKSIVTDIDFNLNKNANDYYENTNYYDLNPTKGNETLKLSDKYYYNKISTHMGFNGSYVFYPEVLDINGNKILLDPYSWARPYKEDTNGYVIDWLDGAEKYFDIDIYGNSFNMKVNQTTNLSKSYRLKISNPLDPDNYGYSFFTLRFEGDKPVFTFEKMAQRPKVTYLTKKSITETGWLYDLNYKNSEKRPVLLELALVDENNNYKNQLSVDILPNEFKKESISVLKSDFLENPNQKLKLTVNKAIVEEIELIDFYATDILGHWASKAIVNLIDKSIIYTGNGSNLKERGGRFEPNKPITRGEFASYLAQYATKDLNLDLKNLSNNQNNMFRDVSSKHIHANAINAMASAGIIKGADGTFKPDATLTRQEAAVMLKNLLALKVSHFNQPASILEHNKLSFYKDASSISDFAKESLSFCVLNDIMKGSSNNVLMPKSSITKAEVATIIYNLCNANIEAYTW